MMPEDMRIARLRLGWTQAELARRIGVSRRTIGRWEMGETPLPLMLASYLEQARQEMRKLEEENPE